MRLNPFIVRELRGGLRTGRRIALLTFFLGILSVFFLATYAAVAATLQTNGDRTGGGLGAVFFPTMAGVALFFVCMLTPAQTASSIVGERERQTYDVLLTTPLTPWQIILGKLATGLAYVALLLIAASPVMSLAFLLGGVDPVEVLLGAGLLTATLLLFGSIGLWSSAICRSSRAATALSYALMGLLTLGLPVALPFGAALLAVLSQSHPALVEQPPIWLVAAGDLLAATNPWVVAGITQYQLSTGGSLLLVSPTLGKTQVDLPAPWLLFAVFALLGSLLALRAAATTLRRRRAGR